MCAFCYHQTYGFNVSFYGADDWIRIPHMSDNGCWPFEDENTPTLLVEYGQHKSIAQTDDQISKTIADQGLTGQEAENYVSTSNALSTKH